MGPGIDAVIQPFLATPKEANQQLKLLWLGCGADDGLLAGNKKFAQTLTDKGINHEWVVTPDYAHWWTLWRVYLNGFLQKIFTESAPQGRRRN